LREQFGSRVPNPGRAIAQHHLTQGFGETAAAGLAVRARQNPTGGCVKKTRNRRAVRKMKEDPSEPPCRRGLQTALSCFGPKGRGGER
jgi:hypothetical protein